MLTSAAAERSGTVVRAGAQIRYELFGSGEQAVFLLPTWSIVHTDFWRHQVPHLADRYTVLTFDGLGNGASDRPTDPAYYSDDAFVDDAVKVLDAAGIDEAALVSVSMAAGWQLLLAHRFPERVAACVYVSTDLPLARLPPGYAEAEESFDQHLSDPVGWQMWNRRFWHQDWEAFCRFFYSRCFTDPDSEQEIEHFVSMGLETTPDVIAATVDAVGISEQQAREAAAAVTAPTLILHGEKDAISSVDASRELARLTSGDLVVLPEAGHEPQCRYPHTVNRMLDAFLARVWGSPH